MHPSSFHYFPLTWPFSLLLFVLFLLAVGLIQLRILEYAYERMGIPPAYVFGILLMSLLGSYVNVPVAELPPERVVSNQVVWLYGVAYVVPAVKEWPGTVIAVNLGGALIPTVLSAYLLWKNRLFVRGPIAIVVVAVVMHMLAHPVRGLGISVPILTPPLVAAGVAMALYWRNAPPLAYIAGCMGTLIGADLMNLGKIQGLGAPIASIGGAGTFDGIFLTGILAVLLPPMGRPRRPPPPPPPQDEIGPAQQTEI